MVAVNKRPNDFKRFLHMYDVDMEIIQGQLGNIVNALDSLLPEHLRHYNTSQK